VVVTPDLSPEMDEPPFDLVVRFDHGAVVDRQDRRARKPAELEIV
jgi:hypothetical protein